MECGRGLVSSDGMVPIGGSHVIDSLPRPLKVKTISIAKSIIILGRRCTAAAVPDAAPANRKFPAAPADNQH